MSVPRPSVRRGRLSSRLSLLSALSLALPSLANAQEFQVLVSLVAPDDLGAQPVTDGELIAQAPGQMARLAWPAETLSLLAGEPGTAGLHLVFGDIDAVHDAGGVLAGAGLYLSLVSDEAGFKDGDVLRPGATGFEVFLSEDAFVTATGASDGNVDVDAFHIDADGSVLFSFADVESSSLLSGDGPGVIGDGAILSWMPPAGQAQVLYTESQVDAFVSMALGSATATGDTKGLARDPTNDAILFVVQAPSAHDASVFSTAGGGSLVAGHAEADFGFTGGNVELDALSIVANPWPSLTVSDGLPAAGSTVTFDLQGAVPGEPHALLLALASGPSLLTTAGWGGLVLAPDALFNLSIASLAAQSMLPDGLGQASISFTVPTPHQALDVVAQAVSISFPHSASNPVVVEVEQ